MTSTVGSAIVSKYVCLSCGVIAVPAVAVHNGGMIFTHQHHAVQANDDVTSRIGCALFGTHHYTSRILRDGMRFGVEGHHTREYLHIADMGRGFIISGIEHI